MHPEILTQDPNLVETNLFRVTIGRNSDRRIDNSKEDIFCCSGIGGWVSLAAAMRPLVACYIFGLGGV